MKSLQTIFSEVDENYYLKYSSHIEELDKLKKEINIKKIIYDNYSELINYKRITYCNQYVNHCIMYYFYMINIENIKNYFNIFTNSIDISNLNYEFLNDFDVNVYYKQIQSKLYICVINNIKFFNIYNNHNIYCINKEQHIFDVNFHLLKYTMYDTDAIIQNGGHRNDVNMYDDVVNTLCNKKKQKDYYKDEDFTQSLLNIPNIHNVLNNAKIYNYYNSMYNLIDAHNVEMENYVCYIDIINLINYYELIIN